MTGRVRKRSESPSSRKRVSVPPTVHDLYESPQLPSPLPLDLGRFPTADFSASSSSSSLSSSVFRPIADDSDDDPPGNRESVVIADGDNHRHRDETQPSARPVPGTADPLAREHRKATRTRRTVNFQQLHPADIASMTAEVQCKYVYRCFRESKAGASLSSLEKAELRISPEHFVSLGSAVDDPQSAAQPDRLVSLLPTVLDCWAAAVALPRDELRPGQPLALLVAPSAARAISISQAFQRSGSVVSLLQVSSATGLGCCFMLGARAHFSSVFALFF